MKVFYDTEFLELGPRFPITLVSIGMVREDGAEFYAVNGDLGSSHLRTMQQDDWLRDNVLAHLPRTTEPLEALGWGLDTDHPDVMSMRRIASEVEEFCQIGVSWSLKEKAELWAYYADYDHVVLSQLFGRMIDLPAHMPMYTRDLKQVIDMFGITDVQVDSGTEHHALADAKGVRDAYHEVCARLKTHRGFDLRSGVWYS